jgi:hypothetical protein
LREKLESWAKKPRVLREKHSQLSQYHNKLNQLKPFLQPTHKKNRQHRNRPNQLKLLLHPPKRPHPDKPLKQAPLNLLQNQNTQPLLRPSQKNLSKNQALNQPL